jgi:hypothetical protein
MATVATDNKPNPNATRTRRTHRVPQPKDAAIVGDLDGQSIDGNSLQAQVAALNALKNPIPPLLRSIPYVPQHGVELPKGYVSIFSTFYYMTPEMAEKLYQAYYWKDNQRKIDPSHVDFLASQMVADSDGYIAFRAGTEVTFGCVGEDYYTVNSNHTLKAIIQSGNPLLVQLNCYRMTDRHALGLLGESFDNNKKRTESEQVAYMPIQPAYVGHVTKLMANNALRMTSDFATAFRLHSSDNVKRAAHDKNRFACHFGKAVLAYSKNVKCRCLAEKEVVERFRSKPLLIVGTVLYHYVEDKARVDEFFSALKRYKSFEQGSAIRSLGEILTAFQVRDLQPDYFLTVLFGAWNSYVNGIPFLKDKDSVDAENRAIRANKATVPPIKVALTEIDTEFCVFNTETLAWELDAAFRRNGRK